MKPDEDPVQPGSVFDEEPGEIVQPAWFLIERANTDAVIAVSAVGTPKAVALLRVDHPFFYPSVVGDGAGFRALLTLWNRL